MTIGKQIRERRESLGIGLRELARRTELSPTTLSLLENDEHSGCQVQTLWRVCEKLGMSMDAVMVQATDERPTVHAGEFYRHYKGGLYCVVGIGFHSESGESLVIYRPADAPAVLWARPLSMWFEWVDYGGATVQRFRREEA